LSSIARIFRISSSSFANLSWAFAAASSSSARIASMAASISVAVVAFL